MNTLTKELGDALHIARNIATLCGSNYEPGSVRDCEFQQIDAALMKFDAACVSERDTTDYSPSPPIYREECEECDRKGWLPHTTVGGEKKLGMMPCPVCDNKARPKYTAVMDGPMVGTLLRDDTVLCRWNASTKPPRGIEVEYLTKDHILDLAAAHAAVRLAINKSKSQKHV